MNLTSISNTIFEPLGRDSAGTHVYNRSFNQEITLKQYLSTPLRPILLTLFSGGLFNFKMNDNMVLGNLPEGKDCKVLGNQCHAEGLSTQAGYSAPCNVIDKHTVKIENIIDTPFYNGAQATLYNLNGGNGPTIITGIVNNVSVDDSINATIITFKDILTSHNSGYIALNSNFQSHSEGEETVASGKNSHAGGKGTIADLPGKFAQSDNYFNQPGDGQYSSLGCGCITIDDSPITLNVDGSNIKIRNNISYFFVAMISARKSDGSVNALFMRYGIIKNIDNTVSLEGSVNTLATDINSASWNVTITADDVNKALKIEVIGENDTIIHWKCRLDCVEIG